MYLNLILICFNCNSWNFDQFSGLCQHADIKFVTELFEIPISCIDWLVYRFNNNI